MDADEKNLDTAHLVMKFTKLNLSQQGKPSLEQCHLYKYRFQTLRIWGNSETLRKSELTMDMVEENWNGNGHGWKNLKLQWTWLRATQGLVALQTFLSSGKMLARAPFLRLRKMKLFYLSLSLSDNQWLVLVKFCHFYLEWEQSKLCRTISADWWATRAALGGTRELEVIAFLLIQTKVQQ